jgi:hypothetical protein
MVGAQECPTRRKQGQGIATTIGIITIGTTISIGITMAIGTTIGKQ